MDKDCICPKPTPELGGVNYVDARTPEEREADSKIKYTVTYATQDLPEEQKGWEEEFDKIAVYTNEYGYTHKIPKYDDIKEFISILLTSHVDSKD